MVSSQTKVQVMYSPIQLRHDLGFGRTFVINPSSLTKALGGFFRAHSATSPARAGVEWLHAIQSGVEPERGGSTHGVASLSGDERTTEPTAASRSNCCPVRFSRSGEVQVRASQGSSGSMSGVASTGVRAENPASKRVGSQAEYASMNNGRKGLAKRWPILR